MSSVLATVILIAITLMSAIAVGGFYFGLLGSFANGSALTGYSSSFDASSSVSTSTTSTSPPLSVTVTPTSCTASGKTKSKCALEVTNEGSSPVTISKNLCLIVISGVPTVGTNPSKAIKPGKSTSFTCAVDGSEPPKGTAATGLVQFSQGSSSFSGTWS